MAAPPRKVAIVLRQIFIDCRSVVATISIADLVQELQIFLEIVAFVEVDEHPPRRIKGWKNETLASRKREDREAHEAFRAAGTALTEADNVMPGQLLND